MQVKRLHKRNANLHKHLKHQEITLETSSIIRSRTNIYQNLRIKKLLNQLWRFQVRQKDSNHTL